MQSTTERLVHVSDEIPDDLSVPMNNLRDDTMRINYACTNLPFSVRDKIKLLQVNDVFQRLVEVLKLENRDIQLNELKTRSVKRHIWIWTSSKRNTSCSSR